MKKQSVYTLTGGVILALTLLASTSNGKDKHYIVKLKGNVLYAGHKEKKTSDDNSIPNVVAAKQARKKKSAENTAEVRPEIVSVTPVKQTVKAAPVVKNIPSVERNPLIKQGTIAVQNMADIHNKIFGLFPGTYLDSMAIVNQLLNDSIRNEMVKSNSSEQKQYLKLCLDKSLQDSVTLSRLNILSSPDMGNIARSNGNLIVHCKDASSGKDMDSVVMDVFNGSSLVATATSDKNGTIKYGGIPEGNYYVVFSHKSYAPFSLMRAKVSGTGQSYIDIPLNRQDGYLFQVFGKNAWLFVTTGVIFLLFIMTIMAYYLAKFNARRELRTA